MRVLAGAVALLSIGCQSYESGIQLICESPKHCGPCDKLKGEARVRALQDYASEHVRNEDAKRVLRSLEDAPADERGKQLREIATKASVAACPMAEVMTAGTPSAESAKLRD